MTPELEAAARPARPDEVFRVAARCAEGQCRHFDSGTCGLARRIVDNLKPAVDRLPKCAIRSSCRWWDEQGVSACFRCPGITTYDTSPSPEMTVAAGA